MKKCIVVSDSFKGTLSSQEICTLAAQRLEAYFPGCEVVRIPVADGGEGTVACFHEACGGTLVSVPVSGPYGEAITAEYLQLPGGQAVIEMASAAGLPQVEDRKDPCKTTTYGVGQLIRHAVETGNQNILLGLGGSCTNDGGCGCAAADVAASHGRHARSITRMWLRMRRLRPGRFEGCHGRRDGVVSCVRPSELRLQRQHLHEPGQRALRGARPGVAGEGLHAIGPLQAALAIQGDVPGARRSRLPREQRRQAGRQRRMLDEDTLLAVERGRARIEVVGADEDGPVIDHHRLGMQARSR